MDAERRKNQRRYVRHLLKAEVNTLLIDLFDAVHPKLRTMPNYHLRKMVLLGKRISTMASVAQRLLDQRWSTEVLRRHRIAKRVHGEQERTTAFTDNIEATAKLRHERWRKRLEIKAAARQEGATK